jgi:hypothetical protein
LLVARQAALGTQVVVVLVGIGLLLVHPAAVLLLNLLYRCLLRPLIQLRLALVGRGHLLVGQAAVILFLVPLHLMAEDWAVTLVGQLHLAVLAVVALALHPS